MSEEAWIVFIILVFGTGFLLSQVLVTSVFGENRRARRRIRQRLSEVASEEDARAVSLLREEYLRSLAPWETRLESLPGMDSLRRTLQQAGKRRTPAYYIVLQSLGATIAGGLAIGILSKSPVYGSAGGLGLSIVPFALVSRQRRSRLERFEEQFPEALDTMARAMRAGHPYNLSLKFVAEELSPPVSEEFGDMFSEINYGGDHRRALLNLLDRIPSVTVMAFVTAVLIQRESGGDLAELMRKLASTVRERFRFKRTMQTLSAQGRLSAWILTLEPFVLFGILWVVAPAYIQELLVDARGPYLLSAAMVFIIFGVLWVRRVISIDV